MTDILEKTMADVEQYGESNDALVFLGCGGDLREWVDGITDMLKDCNIIPRDFEFSFVWKFVFHEPLTIICLLFSIDDDRIDIGKLSIWRIKNQNLDCKWLKDFLDQQYGNTCPVK